MCIYMMANQKIIGCWINDRANGLGLYFSKDGSSYDGSWRNDMQDGYGKEDWPDGSSYVGLYKNGKKNGKGDSLNIRFIN